MVLCCVSFKEFSMNHVTFRTLCVTGLKNETVYRGTDWSSSRNTSWSSAPTVLKQTYNLTVSSFLLNILILLNWFLFYVLLFHCLFLLYRQDALFGGSLLRKFKNFLIRQLTHGQLKKSFRILVCLVLIIVWL